MVQQTAKQAKVPESAYATNGKIPGVNLHHNHLVDLRASGLSNETIKSSGCYSESNFSELKVLMNYGGAKKWPPKNGAALVFPYLDHDGKTMFYRVKPDNPPLRDGKRAKYLQPSGTAVRVYIPPQARKKLKDKSNRLIITEGEKKALAGTQAGVTTIGLPGVIGDTSLGAKQTVTRPDHRKRLGETCERRATIRSPAYAFGVLAAAVCTFTKECNGPASCP